MIEREVDVYEANGVLVKQIRVRDSGTVVHQHSHPYDHLSLLTSGAIEVWLNGEHIQNFVAPEAMTILANVNHEFVTLEDDTIIYCVHNSERMN